MLQITEHILQSEFWKESKNALGNQTFDFDGGWFQTTPVPFFGWKVGYAPRVNISRLNLDSLKDAARKAGCVFVKIDPNEYKDQLPITNYQFILRSASENGLRGSDQISKSIHLRKNILIDLTIPEEDHLALLDKKVRYTIKQSQKMGFTFQEDKTLNNFLDLHEKTVFRQKFSGRSTEYLKKVWEIGLKTNATKVFTTTLDNQAQVSSLVFLYKDVLYYTYAGASDSSRSNNASYFHIWSLLNWGRNQNLKIFDFWGIEENETDGFSLFKKKFSGELVEYGESVDVVLSGWKYRVIKLAEKIRNKKG
jgi:lipid II:glycine glycyltransferase (peptidoglycan interpeptide bridge formation enzyme)